jgi:luciferase family oxidoreductase group 1
MPSMISLSVLDLSPIIEGGDASRAFANTLDLARHVEAWGFNRFWLAEHHNMTGIASAATAVVIGHVAGGTSTIRVGSGGIMLPNHAPLVIAEQFGTLEALYPGRIELGLGRAPGTDQRTAQALRRTLQGDANDFPRDVLELQHYFGPVQPDQFVQAVPGAGLNVPIWILGSSLFGAQLAAMLGLPYAFASHFAPAALMQAIELYRAEFKPSQQLAAPYVMAGFNAFAADSEEEADFLRSSSQQSFLSLRRGNPGPLPPPIKNFTQTLSAQELDVLDSVLSCSTAGSPDTVRAGIAEFAARTGADELIVTSHIYDHDKRLRSFEIIADVGIAKA